MKFEVLEAQTDGDLMEKHMGDSRHGLMVYDGEGKLVHVEPGHGMSKADIDGWIKEKLL